MTAPWPAVMALGLGGTRGGLGRRRRSRPGALRGPAGGDEGRRRWLGRRRRPPFPLYTVEAWPGPRFVVERDHVNGRLAELTVGFADAGATDRAAVRVTTTRRPPSRTDERMARHLDPWLAAVVGEARGHDRLDLVADPEAAVELTSRWETATVPVDGQPSAFRVRVEDEAWVAYARGADHAVIVCAESTRSLVPQGLRLATVRDVAALESGGRGGRRGRDRPG